MNDDVGPDARRFEVLRLLKNFLRITDPDGRRKILALVERLAEDAGSTIPGADAFFEPAKDIPRPTE